MLWRSCAGSTVLDVDVAVLEIGVRNDQVFDDEVGLASLSRSAGRLPLVRGSTCLLPCT